MHSLPHNVNFILVKSDILKLLAGRGAAGDQDVRAGRDGAAAGI
jgi:hypothetical protein